MHKHNHPLPRVRLKVGGKKTREPNKCVKEVDKFQARNPKQIRNSPNSKPASPLCPGPRKTNDGISHHGKPYAVAISSLSQKGRLFRIVLVLVLVLVILLVLEMKTTLSLGFSMGSLRSEDENEDEDENQVSSVLGQALSHSLNRLFLGVRPFDIKWFEGFKFGICFEFRVSDFRGSTGLAVCVTHF